MPLFQTEVSYSREGSREVSIPTPAPSTQWSYLPEFGEKDALEKRKQKVSFDLQHRARPLPPLEPEQNVWIRTEGRVDPGHVLNPTSTPRSYRVETSSGVVRRNQAHVTP